MEDNSTYNVPAVAYVLQSHMSTVAERVAALRSLKKYLETNTSMDAYSKKRIKQLILDNVLQMILSEEKVTNVVKRQMVRTELFLILANLLDSSVLFGSIFGTEVPHPNANAHAHAHAHDEALIEQNSTAISGSSSSRILQPPGGWVKSKPGKDAGERSRLMSQSHSAAQLQTLAYRDAWSPVQGSRATSRGGSPGADGTPGTGVRRRSVGQSADLALLKPIIHRQARNKQMASALGPHMSKTWRPRPSIIHSELVADSFVPGADPLNYLEQDRKLGYQKPRMWFPGMVGSAQNSLLPEPRAVSTQKQRSAVEQVVQEYMQMRSLASYVGDLVAPYTPAGPKGSYMSASTASEKPGSAKPGGAHTSRLANLTDHSRFAAALKEVAAVWSPLLGTHLPPQHQLAPLPGIAGSTASRKRKIGSALAGGSAAGENGLYQEYAQEIVPFKCLRVEKAGARRTHPHPHPPPPRGADSGLPSSPSRPGAGTRTGGSVRGDTTSIPRSLHRIEVGDEDEAQETRSDNLYLLRAQQYQMEVSAHLQTQRDHVLASIRASEKLIAATLQAGYRLLQPKYLLLLEGKKANSRAVIATAMATFCRVKRRNVLAMAFGCWKILLVEMASVARRPLYARVAACHLMARWQQEVHLKRLRVWIVRWRRRAAVLIFLQRSQAVITIQKLYRTWRDRRKFVAMHLAKTFQGVLSDIYLAPKRKGLPFFVPDVIRNDRRLLWLAATIIQTVYRCYIASKDYFYKRRMILLIQSVIRMFPKYRKYRRLKATTIKCQAWVRRTVKQVQYKRLKRATIIVQKYVRRYLGILRKLRTFERMWRDGARPLAAAIRIQCRYRIHLAKRRLRFKRYMIAKRKYSALVIQRSYYRYKRAFHTFLLMCCLREREALDIAEIRRKVLLDRHAAATVIQQRYRERFFRRNLGAIVKVQCWFRGRMGYSLVDVLRRERWASRKIRAWVRVRVRRRQEMALRIQRWWWEQSPGRLRRHLWWRLLQDDQAQDLARGERRHFAAMRIQAYVKGVWDRRWVRRHRAALLIQRNAKFFFALKRWRRWKRERIMKVVRRYVAHVEERALKHVHARILRRQSDNMKKPQALARGFIVRNIMQRAKWHAYRMGIAVVKIQRFWRQTGAVAQAVDEVMALRRERSNPFVPCGTPHEVLGMMRRHTKPYYSTFDPRVGLRVSAFLYRLGCQELAEMFPRKHYVTVSDMMGLSMYKLLELHEAFKTRAEKAGKDKTTQGSVKVKKKNAAPTQLFETILSIVNPPLYTTIPKHRDKVRTLQALPEYETPARAMDGFKRVFQRKFGRNLNARAEHMARDLLQLCWGEFNNYKTVGSVLTKHQIIKAVNAASESNNPLQLLDEVRQRNTPVVDEKKWDRERIGKAAELLQLAVDRLLQLLPPGRLRTMVERANNRVASYRRKMSFLRQKMVAAANPAPPVPARRNRAVSQGSDITNHSPQQSLDHASLVSDPSPATLPPASVVTHPSDPQAGSVEARGALDLANSEVLSQVLPVTRSLELPFNSDSLADLDLECDIGVCRVFFDALDRLYMMTAAVQSLKNSWYNNSLRRTVARQKAAEFKQAVKERYLNERGEDRVRHTWLKHKRMETSKKKLDIIMKAVLARKAGFKFELSFVPRHGWVSVEDGNGYAYWMDTKPRGAQPSTYEMPVYTVSQYFMLMRIQRAARLFLERLQERKRQREIEALAEVARLEALMEEERKMGARVVKTRLHLISKLLDGSADVQPKHHHKVVDPVPTVESLLPWRYRFYEAPVLQPGFWALLRLNQHHHHHHHQQNHQDHSAQGSGPFDGHQQSESQLVAQYELVTVFRIREGEGLCDVRNVKGRFHRNVHLHRLTVMNYDVGTAVEARYRQEQVFYRANITHIDTTSARFPQFSIRYEDGEAAAGLRWDAIRPSQATLRSFLRGREEHMRTAAVRHRRLAHYHKLRRERVASYEGRVSALWKNAVANNPHLLVAGQVGPESRSESPVLLLADGPSVSTRGDGASPTLISDNEDGQAEDGGETDEAGTADNITVSSEHTALVPYAGRSGSHSEKTSLVPAAHRPRFRIDLRVHLPYSKVCNIYGWRTSEVYDEVTGRYVLYYVNDFTDEASDAKPEYSALEVQSARRLQLAWLAYSARCKVWRRVLALNLTEMIRETIKKCAKIAYVGYELEGVTSMQILRRAGYWELAEVLEAYYKGLKWNISNVTIEEIARKPKDEYEHMGVIQMAHQRDLKEFQTWWARSSNTEKQRRLALFNYYKSPEDERDIRKCIKDSEELMVTKFIKHIKAGAARTRAAVQIVMTDAHFPHAHMQVETYLRKYGDKAELARDSVFELINKPTTHTYVEEKVVLRHYRLCTRLIRAALGLMKLRSMRSVVVKVERRVEEILRTVPAGQRTLCTGPEAKAALLLRTRVLKFIMDVIQAVEVIQRNVRCYLLSKKWSVYLIARTRSIDLLQRTARRYLAYKLHRGLTEQRLSEWEQLWDSRRNLLYYYNHVTGASQYAEPDCPFRPLVRDPASSALIQAWPDLDNRNGMLALLPPTQGTGAVPMHASHTHCGICRTRRCVRICLECTDEAEWDASKYHAFPYCFPCFMKEHQEDNESRANHQYTVVGESDPASTPSDALVPVASGTEQLVLRCCMCEELATRKCQGMLDDECIEEICLELKRTSPEEWLNVLKARNVAGDRKLTLLLDQIRSESNAVLNGLVAFQSTEAGKEATAAAKARHQHHRDKTSSPSPVRNRKQAEEEKASASEPSSPPITKMLSAAHLQAVRTLMEQQRAECDECYCASCYREVHAGGRRAQHKWKGFCAKAAVCTVCTNCPAELSCFDCETKYCGSCYKVFHGMGRKRNHKREKVLEPLREGVESYCGFCERRPADTRCDHRRCNTAGCDSCVEFRHKPQCGKDIVAYGLISPSHRARAMSSASEASQSPTSPVTRKRQVQSNAADTDPDACVVCGEEADQRCVQCGDCYCSRTWMGNPGCFVQHHSKGNRASHTTELFMSRRAVAQSMKRSLRQSRKSLLA